MTKPTSSYTCYNYSYQPETAEAAQHVNDIAAGTVAAQSMNIGMNNAEPLVVIMDSLIRYAKAHEKRFGSKIADDGFCGEPWLEMAKGCRALLSADGGVALEIGRTTDSKDNGMVESMFWTALGIAGFSEADL